MKDTIKYVSLDVSKGKMADAIADEDRDEPRYWGMIPNTQESIRKLVKSLEKKRISECVMELAQLAMVYIDFYLP